MKSRRMLLLILPIGIALPVASQSIDVRIDPIEAVEELAAAEKPLSPETFTRYAFIFSGVSGQPLNRLEAKIQAHIEDLRERLNEVTDPRQQAEYTLAYMHETLLKHYDERETGLDVLVDRGTYNCVSSGVLYAIFLKALGLPVWGVRTSDHAFCRVQAGEQTFDVETTSPFGFDPGTRKDFTDDFGRITGYSYVPPSSYRDRRDIGEKELLGLILYNRTAFASERRDYLGAVQPAVDAYALLADDESRERLITSLLNLASWYGMSGRFSEAVEFLDIAAHRYANDRLEALQEDLTHNWILSLIRKGDYPTAEKLLDSQLSDGGISEGQWRELTVYLYQVRAQKKAAADYMEAAQLILEGLNKVGSDQGLARSYEVYIHNSVVSLVRNARYEEALAVLEQALPGLPDSAVLLKDRAMVLEAAARQ
jgi:Flp pilus assembly protein TadD